MTVTAWVVTAWVAVSTGELSARVLEALPKPAGPLLCPVRLPRRIAVGSAVAAAFCALLVPSGAATQLVRPTLPGGSVFASGPTDPRSTAQVVVSTPRPYRQPADRSPQNDVAVAENLAPRTDGQPDAAAPAQTPATAPEPERAGSTAAAPDLRPSDAPTRAAEEKPTEPATQQPAAAPRATAAPSAGELPEPGGEARPSPDPAPGEQQDAQPPKTEQKPSTGPESAVAPRAGASAQPSPQAQPSPETAPQERQDADRSKAAAGTPTEPVGAAWSSPAPGARISNPFGKPDSGYAAGYHTGTDFAVSVGTPVLAVGDATVVSASSAGAYGNAVVLRLPDGRFALYAHLSKFSVSAGQKVSAGQRIGLSGNTGNSTGPHLHFEIRTVNAYGAVLDPVAYLRQHGATGL